MPRDRDNTHMVPVMLRLREAPEPIPAYLTLSKDLGQLKLRLYDRTGPLGMIEVEGGEEDALLYLLNQSLGRE